MFLTFDTILKNSVTQEERIARVSIKASSVVYVEDAKWNEDRHKRKPCTLLGLLSTDSIYVIETFDNVLNAINECHNDLIKIRKN